MLKTTSIVNKDGKNNVYCNLIVTNTTNAFQPMDLTINRGDKIIDNTEDYYMSIIRFSIPTLSLALFYLDLIKTPLSVTMQYNGVQRTELLVYNSIFSSSAPPLSSGNSLSPPVIEYAIWTYQQFVDMINVAIQKCHDFLFPPINAKKAPYMIYDGNTEKFSIIADNSYIEPSPYSLPLVEKLFFNNALFNYFSNFLGVRDEYAVTGKFQFVFENTFNNSVTTRDGLAGVEMKQEYSTIYLMNSLTSLVITSNSFPVNAEEQFITTITNDSFSNSSLNILTDFEINYASKPSGGDSRSIQQYQPTIYRYTDLKGTSELRNFTLSIYGYLPEQNRYVKLFLQPTLTVSLKILFKKKDLNY